LKRRNIVLGANLLTVIISLIILYGTITPFIGGLKLFDVSALLGRDSTLSGRDEIWAQLIPAAMQKPLLGHGLGGFWNDEWSMSLRVNEAHNGYLDMILNMGFAGLMLISIFLIASCRKARREMTQDSDWGIFWFCIILMTVVHNTTESSLYVFTGLMPMIIFFHISSNSRARIIPNTP
jgi:O-antigen ligase